MIRIKKIIAVALSVAMTLSLCTFGAWGASGSGGVTTAANLSAAIAAGGTVTLGGNIDLGTLSDSNGLTTSGDGYSVHYYACIPAGKNVTLDLNGHTITAAEGEGTYDFTLFYNCGTFTIKDSGTDGSITVSNTKQFNDAVCSSVVYNRGSMTVDSGALTITSTGAAAAPYNIAGDMASVIYSKSEGTAAASVTVNGGTLTSSYAVIHNMQRGKTTNVGAVTINGGTLTGARRVVYMHQPTTSSHGSGTLTITGGTFSSDARAISVDMMSTDPVTVSITGGDFRCKVATIDAADAYQSAVSISITGGTFSDFSGLEYYSGTGAYNVKLADDLTLTAPVNVDKEVVLDLAGHEITPTSSFADNYLLGVKYGGKLTINDSSAGKSGAITNGENVKVSTAVKMTLTGEAYANNKAVLVVNGGTLCGYCYGVAGNGTRHNTDITINGGIVKGVAAGDNFGIYHPQSGTLSITGGTITGESGGIAIKSGTLSITGGTVRCTGADSTPTAGYSNGVNASGAAIQIESNSDYAGAMNITVSGGNIISDNGCSIYEYIGKGSDTAVSAMSVTGGNFKGGIMTSDKFAATTIAKFVSGGYFTVDPSAYVADGKAAIASDKSGYTYMVGVKGENPALPAVAAPVVVSEVTGSTTVTNAVKEITDNANTTTQSGLEGAAATAANNSNVTETQVTNALVGVTQPAGATAKVYEQAYLDITVTDVATTGNGGDETVTQITVSITPMVKTVASYADTAAGITDGNSAQIDEAKPLTVNNDVTIKLPIPAALAVAVEGGYKPLTVKHVKENGAVYYYDATVTQESDIYYATFTVTHGFSDFTLMAQDTRSATVTFDNSIGNKHYGVTNVGDTLPTVSKSGYTFSGWKFTAINGDEISGATGVYTTMTYALLTALYNLNSDHLAAATAQFTQNSSSSGGGTSAYIITATAGSNGTVTPSGKTSVASGKSQTYTIKANDGYAVADVTVDGKSVGAVTTYTFSTVKASHTISAIFKTSAWVNPFKDVSESAWYYDAVRYVNEKGLFEGTAFDTFNPNANMTRGMLVTVLWRMEGQPVVNYAMSFTDVKDGKWYTEAVRWGASEGIVNGYGDNTFRPDAPVMRQELAAFLYRYAQYKGYDVSVGEDTNILSYNDASEISEYAIPAMQWACGSGVFIGEGANLNPKSNATRAQVAQVMMRFCENVAK